VDQVQIKAVLKKTQLDINL